MELFPVWFLFILAGAVVVGAAIAWHAMLIPLLGIAMLTSAALAPVGGVMYACSPRVPESQESSITRWLIGAIAMSLLFVPWLYLMAHAYGKQPRQYHIIERGYHVLYCGWCLVLFPYLTAVSILGLLALMDPTGTPELPAYLTVLVVGLLVLLVAVYRVSKRVLWNVLRSHTNESGQVDLRRRDYLMPFISFYCAAALVVTVWWATRSLYCPRLTQWGLAGLDCVCGA